MPSKGALTLAKFNSASASSTLAWALASLALYSAHLILRDTFFVGQRLDIIQLQLREVSLGHRGVPLCLVKNWHDLEHHLALFHRLAFLDRDGLEIPVLQCTDIDVSPRVDLADILLGDDDVLCDRAGDRDLLLLVVGLLVLVLVKIRLILADDAPLTLDVHAQGIKMRVKLGSVQRRDVHSHLVQAEDPAADQGGDQHQGYHQPSHDGLLGSSMFN